MVEPVSLAPVLRPSGIPPLTSHASCPQVHEIVSTFERLNAATLAIASDNQECKRLKGNQDDTCGQASDEIETGNADSSVSSPFCDESRVQIIIIDSDLCDDGKDCRNCSHHSCSVLRTLTALSPRAEVRFLKRNF